MKNKTKYTKLKIIFAIITVLMVFSPFSQVFGQINPYNSENLVTDVIKNILGTFLQLGLGPLGAAIASLINVILLIVVVLLSTIFMPVSSGILFPTPDQLIFNQLSFFDPNFINPPTYSTEAIVFVEEGEDKDKEATNNIEIKEREKEIVHSKDPIKHAPAYILQDVLKKLYYTGYVVAGSVFVLAAMLIGIKLAITSIASEKAHYKEMIGVWLKGLVLLLTLHIIIAGIFALNEFIVNQLYLASTTISFDVNIMSLIGGMLGKIVSDILNFIGSLFNSGSSPNIGYLKMYGFQGLMLKFVAEALGGDLSAAICAAVIVGQSVTIIFMYMKRMIVCMMLAVIAPLIVAADIVKKAI